MATFLSRFIKAITLLLMLFIVPPFLPTEILRGIPLLPFPFPNPFGRGSGESVLIQRFGDLLAFENLSELWV